MAMIWLKLNDEKTLSLLLRTPTVGPLSNISDIIIGDNNITLSPSARNLGDISEEHLNMEAHVNSVCRSFFPPAQHQLHSKSSGYEDNCHHCPGPSHFPTSLLQHSALWTPSYTHKETAEGAKCNS